MDVKMMQLVIGEICAQNEVEGAALDYKYSYDLLHAWTQKLTSYSGRSQPYGREILAWHETADRARWTQRPTSGALYNCWQRHEKLLANLEDVKPTMENADILVRRFDIETASGVLWVIKRKGMTGWGAQYFSTETKSRPKITLATRNPETNGSDHNISSVVFKLNPKRRQPTAPTSVRDPRKSIRRNLSDNLWFWTSSGSRMLTLVATNTKLKSSTGVCNKLV